MYQQQQQPEPSFIDGFFASIPPFINWAFAVAGAVLGYLYGIEHGVFVPITIALGFLAGLIFIPLVAVLLKFSLVAVIVVVIVGGIFIAYRSQEKTTVSTTSMTDGLRRATDDALERLHALITPGTPIAPSPAPRQPMPAPPAYQPPVQHSDRPSYAPPQTYAPPAYAAPAAPVPQAAPIITPAPPPPPEMTLEDRYPGMVRPGTGLPTADLPRPRSSPRPR